MPGAGLKLLVKRLSPSAVVPCRGSSGAAGYDLSASACVVIPAKGQAIVPTDLSIAVPSGTYGRVAPRSGLAAKYGIDVGAGVVDSDYRGPLGIILFNHGNKDYEIKQGDRVAQLILEKIAVLPVEEVEELDNTDRGSGGFGSTGFTADVIVHNNKRTKAEEPQSENSKDSIKTS